MKGKYCKPGQVWWANLNPTTGREQNGVRPIYIACKFSGDLIWAFPLTTKEKKGSWYLPFFLYGQKEATSRVILSQSRTIDSKRLIRKMGKAHISQFYRITKSFESLIKKYGGDYSPPRNL